MYLLPAEWRFTPRNRIKRHRLVLNKNMVNCFFLTIIRTLNIFIKPYYCFILLFYMLNTIKFMQVMILFEIAVKNLILLM